jgi:putative ABC transport system substrate-binding protein
MRRLGYVEGQNLTVQLFSGEGQEQRYAVLAREVVQQSPDVIFGVAAMVRHLKSVTSTIPIVALTGDPVAFGIVGNLARPGGNITGVSLDAGLEIWGKRIELLKVAVPALAHISFLGTRRIWESVEGQAVRESARRTGIVLHTSLPEGVLQDGEYRRLFASMPQDVQAVLISDDAENFRNRKLLADLAAEKRLPAISPWREHAELGGFIAYAFDLPDVYRHAAWQIDQILKGTKAGDIPFYQSRKFELVINLKAAKALGLTIPPELLARADEVIE